MERSRPAAGGVAAVGVLVAGLAVGGCSLVPGIGAPSPCAWLAGWPPDLPDLPAELTVVRNADGSLAATNHAPTATKIRMTTWTPGDCDRTSGVPEGDGLVLQPGMLASWNGWPEPAAGPVMITIEAWTGPCDEACDEPADRASSFELPPPGAVP